MAAIAWRPKFVRTCYVRLEMVFEDSELCHAFGAPEEDEIEEHLSRRAGCDLVQPSPEKLLSLSVADMVSSTLSSYRKSALFTALACRCARMASNIGEGPTSFATACALNRVAVVRACESPAASDRVACSYANRAGRASQRPQPDARRMHGRRVALTSRCALFLSVMDSRHCYISCSFVC